MDDDKALKEKKILITGAHGFVGHKLMEMNHHMIAAPSLRNINAEEIYCLIEKSDADVIIHTSAIADIGMCEKNSNISYDTNVQVPINIAKASKNKKLICFSSDQVYNGCIEEGPYVEGNENPSNVYAKHKLEMEQRVLDIHPDSVMLRAEWMYDYYLEKINYFMLMIQATEQVSFSYKQFRGITYLKEVVENMDYVFSLPGGSYNFGSETDQSIYDITKEFYR